jgi:hypothetical protein
VVFGVPTTKNNIFEKKEKKRKGNIGRIILFLLLALCFSFQVWDSWQKFWDGKTSMAVSVIPAPLETLPAITLCTEPVTNTDIMRDKFNLSSDMFTSRPSQYIDLLPKNVTINDIRAIELYSKLELVWRRQYNH